LILKKQFVSFGRLNNKNTLMASENRRFLFLVDDEPIQNEMLKDYLNERFLYEVKVFESGEEALKNLHLNPEIVILDYHLSAHDKNAKNGVEILKAIKEAAPTTQVIILSGQDKINVAVDTMKYGAYDYVVKGESAFSRIENVINNASELHKMKVINKGYRNTIIMLVTVIALIIVGTLIYFMSGGN
jgi:two-component system OmpR family response regulator